MLLQGSLSQFNLPNIFQLVKMSSGTGALSLRRGDVGGKVFFKGGHIYYAFATPQAVPLGQRFVNSGHITAAQLREALVEQQGSSNSDRLGSILLAKGWVDRGALEDVVAEQIQDAVFDFFSWPDGEFEFTDDELAAGEDIVVEMQTENVIMESCRRIDEWEFIFEQLGSLERIPHLTHGSDVEDQGGVALTVDEWRGIVHIDGRADINTVIRDCGFDRFHGAKVLYDLYSRGLISVADPLIDDIGKVVSVAVRGPVDTYCEIFLNTLTDSRVVKQLRVELIDENEIEVPILAGMFEAGEGEAGDAGAALVYTASSAAPDDAWRRLARESSVWVLLANANDKDSLRRARADLAFVRSLGDTPLVVATYVSRPDAELGPDEIIDELGIGADTPVIPCRFRDRASVTGVVKAALALIGN